MSKKSEVYNIYNRNLTKIEEIQVLQVYWSYLSRKKDRADQIPSKAHQTHLEYVVKELRILFPEKWGKLVYTDNLCKCSRLLSSIWNTMNDSLVGKEKREGLIESAALWRKLEDDVPPESYIATAGGPDEPDKEVDSKLKD